MARNRSAWDEQSGQMIPPIMPWWVVFFLLPFILLDFARAALKRLTGLGILLGMICHGSARADALDEVNASRATWGRPPLIRVEAYDRAAQKIAEWQAYYQISLQTGYTGHEHPRTPDYQPPGTTTGTGVASSYGWASCLMECRGQYPAGAGVAIGADGRRYMALVVQGNPNAFRGLGTVTMARTRHLTPYPPVMAKGPRLPAPWRTGVPHGPFPWEQYPQPEYARKFSVLVERIGPNRTIAEPSPATGPRRCPDCGQVH